MNIGTWLVMALVVGVILILLVARVRGRRRALWCPEREMLAEVDMEGDVYAGDRGGRLVRFCSLWDPSVGLGCGRACLTRFSHPDRGRGE